jgi:hypothetical protein
MNEIRPFHVLAVRETLQCVMTSLIAVTALDTMSKGSEFGSYCCLIAWLLFCAASGLNNATVQWNLAALNRETGVMVDLLEKCKEQGAFPFGRYRK